MVDDDAPEHIERMLRHPVNKGRPWTADHDEYLRAHLPMLGCRAVAYRIGRTMRAVYERASRLGVAHGPSGRKPTWTADDDAVVLEWVRRAARALGRTEQAVAMRAHRLSTGGHPCPRGSNLRTSTRRNLRATS